MSQKCIGCEGDGNRVPELPEEKVKEYMRMALVEAKQALDRCEVPVGCVVVRGDEVLATGSNRGNELCNGTRLEGLRQSSYVHQLLLSSGL